MEKFSLVLNMGQNGTFVHIFQTSAFFEIVGARLDSIYLKQTYLKIINLVNLLIMYVCIARPKYDFSRTSNLAPDLELHLTPPSKSNS